MLGKHEKNESGEFLEGQKGLSNIFVSVYAESCTSGRLSDAPKISNILLALVVLPEMCAIGAPVLRQREEEEAFASEK